MNFNVAIGIGRRAGAAVIPDPGPTEPAEPEIIVLTVTQSPAGIGIDVSLNGTSGYLDWIITDDPNPSPEDIKDGIGEAAGTVTVTGSAVTITAEDVELTYGEQYIAAAVYRKGDLESPIGVAVFSPSSILLEGVYRQNWEGWPYTVDPVDFGTRGYPPGGGWDGTRYYQILNDGGQPHLQAVSGNSNPFSMTPAELSAAVFDVMESEDYDYIEFLFEQKILMPSTSRGGIGFTVGNSDVFLGLRMVGTSLNVTWNLQNRGNLRFGGNNTSVKSLTRTSVDNTLHRIRWRITPTQMMAKVWAASGSEPGSWDATIDADPVLRWRYTTADGDVTPVLDWWGRSDSGSALTLGKFRWYSVGFNKAAPTL